MTIGRCCSCSSLLDLDDLLALAHRLLAEAQVLGPLEARRAARAQRLDPARRSARPRPARRSRAPSEMPATSDGDPEHARAGEAEQRLAQLAEAVAEHAAGMAAGDLRLPLVEPGPFERRAGGEQDGQAEPEMPGRRLGDAPARRSGRAAPAPAPPSQARAADQHRPPDRVADQEEGEVGDPGADDAGLVLHRPAAARGGEARVGGAVRRQREHHQQPGDGAGQQGHLVAPAGRLWPRRGAGASAPPS